jgi:hypothetical protein
MSPERILGIDATMRDAIDFKFLQAPLSKAQLAEVIQIPPRAKQHDRDVERQRVGRGGIALMGDGELRDAAKNHPVAWACVCTSRSTNCSGDCVASSMPQLLTHS